MSGSVARDFRRLLADDLGAPLCDDHNDDQTGRKESSEFWIFILH